MKFSHLRKTKRRPSTRVNHFTPPFSRNRQEIQAASAVSHQHAERGPPSVTLRRERRPREVTNVRAFANPAIANGSSSAPTFCYSARHERRHRQRPSRRAQGDTAAGGSALEAPVQQATRRPSISHSEEGTKAPRSDQRESVCQSGNRKWKFQRTNLLLFGPSRTARSAKTLTRGSG